MHIPLEKVNTTSSIKVVILSRQNEIDLQVYGGAQTGQGAVIDMFAELGAMSRKKKSKDLISDIQNLLEERNVSEVIALKIKENIRDLSWVKTIFSEDVIDSASFDLENELINCEQDSLVVISPIYQLSPWMEMIELRTNIAFYSKNNTTEPYYSTIAVTQSEVVDIPNLDRDSSFLGIEKRLVPSKKYWSADGGEALWGLINAQAEEMGRTVQAALEDASNQNIKDRKYSKIRSKDLRGFYFGSNLEGYYLISYTNGNRDVFRKIPKPMQYPNDAFNAIYSTPKDQTLKSIQDRY